MMESNQASSLLEHKLDADTFICGLCKDQFHDYNVFIEHKRLHTAGSGNKLGVSKQLVVESPSMHNTRKRKTAQCLTTSKPSKTHVDSTADEMECSTRKVRKHTSDLLTKTSDRNTSVSVKVKRERFEDHKIGNQPNFTVSAKSETRTVPSNPQCVHTLHTRKSTRLIARQHRKAKKASFEPDVHEKSGARNVATACSTRTGVHVLKPESDLTRDQVDVRSQPIHVSDDGVVHEKLVATAMKTHHGLSRITTRQITAKKAVSPTDSTRQGISNASTQTNSCVEKTENGQPKSPCFRSQITVYMKAGIYTYQCDKCKEIFDTYIILRRHQRRPVKIEEATVQELESIPGDMVKRDSNRNITGKKGQIVTFIRDTDKPRRGRRPKFIPNVTICHGSKTALCLADGTFQCQQCKVTLKTLQEMEEHCSMRAVKDATGSTLSSKMGKSSTVDTGAGGDQVGSKGTLQAPHETHDAGNSTDGTLQRPHETPDAGNSKDGTLQGSHETPDAGDSTDGTLQRPHETPDAGNSKDGTLQGSHETHDAGDSTDGTLQGSHETPDAGNSTDGTLQRPHETPDAGDSTDGALQRPHETHDAGNSKDGTLQRPHETHDAGNSTDGTLQGSHETPDAGDSTDGALQGPHETPDAGNSKDGTLQGSHETPDADDSTDGTLQGSHETPDAGNSKDGTLQGSHETPDAGDSTDGALQAPPEINHVNQSTNEHDTNADSSGSESPNFSVDSDCIEVIPVFDTQEEEDEFQDYCNSVDLSVVDGLFVRELVEQTGETAATRRSRPRDLVLYRCSVCSKFLSCRKKAREHCVHHADLSPFVCPRCGDQFKLKSNLTVHMRYHTGNMFKCSACPAEFARKDILRNHLTSMHVADGLDCRLCGRVMRSLPTLRNHVKIKHPGAAGRQYIASLRKNERSSPFVLHQCQFCSRYFKKASELDKHLVQHDANMRYRFACKLCDNVSTDAASLRKHCRMHSLVYACAECDGKCVSTLALMEHLTQHSRDKERVESLFRESINCSFYLPDRYIVNEDMKTTAVTDIINQLDIESNWLDDFLKHGATSPNVPPSPGTILIEQACEKASSTPPRLSTALQSLDNGQADVGNVHGSGSVTELKAAMNAENENVDDDDVATNVGYKACSNDWLSQYRKLNAGLLLLIRDLYGPLECEFCGILFCDEPHFHIHVQRHEKSSLKCHFPECKFVTPSKMSLKLHVESAHVKKSFSCVKCDHEAKGRVALWRHCKATHVNAMCCHICKQQFADHELLKSHFEEEHVDNDRRFTSRVVGRHHVCETCGKVFTRTNDLKRHEFWHKGVKPIKCTKANCHFSCRSKSHLSEHVRVKHANTTHLCHLCGVKYKSQRCLAAHVSVHETGAAYACAHCAYTGATEERLKQHLETHKLRVFRCRLCAYVVTTKVSITKHYKEVHPGAERDPEVVPVESIEEKRIYKRGAATVSPTLRRRPPRDEEEECEELQEEAGSVEGREEGELLCGELQLLNKLTSGAGLMPGQVLHCQYDADGSIQLIVADGALEEDGRYVVAEQQQQEEEEETHGNGMQDVFDAQHIITVKEEPAPLDEPMIIVFDGSSENQEQLLQQVVDGRLSLIGEDQLACLEAQVPTAGSHETIVTYVDQSAECIFESAEISADEQSSIDRTQTAVQVLEQLMSLTPSAAASSQISK